MSPARAASKLFVALLLSPSLSAAAQEVEFNRDVRPLLSSKCFQCHGPDDKARKAKLRLDLRDAALKPGKSGHTPIIPGKADQSEILRRVTTSDEDDVMPPAKSGPPLTQAQVSILKRWIDGGAPYALHWAYVKPTRPPVPDVAGSTRPANDIDRFVLARLGSEKLTPSPEADRYALIRRLSLDLTGLPPTLAEADAFAADHSPDAYDRLVDRLLASPAYGERWAQVWLDLARYADSQGFANDPNRTIWRWRDWLIQALNENKPFDQFTVEMLAGDMLPDPTPAQLVATGFHRNTLTNTEGGTQPEEFRVAAVVDRVNTTMQVWTASTFQCAQCHTHKYDPFTQREYYQLYAIFNNTQDANTGDDAPTLQVPPLGREPEAERLKPLVAEAKRKLDEATKELDAGIDDWEKTLDHESLPKNIAQILAQPRKARKPAQQKTLVDYFHKSAPESWKKLDAEHRALDERYKAVVTTTPVMREGKARETHIQLRGNYLAPGDKVEAALPAVFPPPPSDQPINRLTLAQWLVSPDHPMTARVAVNRLWEELFGTGIVETSEDFGTQGEPPSHPELLDYLATEYVRCGWDTKQMLRRIVTSATYRQASAVAPDVARRDPNNRLLSRGPRVRLPAEAVRDQALFAAGLLSRKMYGPPCQPPKPNFGLTAAFGATTDWKSDTGEDRFRRGIYVRVRRNAPYPLMTTFDAPERTSCNVRRTRTNTPLQALVTLNDPCFVEAAQGLARRVVSEGGDTTASRATFAFRACLTRPPGDAELARLTALYEQSRAKYDGEPKLAASMATDPLGPAPQGADVHDLAAWTVVANVLLNLDETLAKR